MSRQSYVTPRCPVCNEATVLDVSASEFLAIRSYVLGGVHIQDALPNWTPERRELVKTGWHPEHWPADPDE